MSLNQVPFQQNTNQVLLPVTERLVQQVSALVVPVANPRLRL